MQRLTQAQNVRALDVCYGCFRADIEVPDESRIIVGSIAAFGLRTSD